MSSTPRTPLQKTIPEWFPDTSGMSEADQARVQQDLQRITSPYHGSSWASRKRFAVGIVEALSETPGFGSRLLQWSSSSQELSISRRDAHTPKHRRTKRPVDNSTPRSPSPDDGDQIIMGDDDNVSYTPPPSPSAGFLTPARTPSPPPDPARGRIADLESQLRASMLEIDMLRAELISSQYDGNQARIALEISQLEIERAQRRKAEAERHLQDAIRLLN